MLLTSSRSRSHRLLFGSMVYGLSCSPQINSEEGNTQKIVTLQFLEAFFPSEDDGTQLGVKS